MTSSGYDGIQINGNVSTSAADSYSILVYGNITANGSSNGIYVGRSVTAANGEGIVVNGNVTASAGDGI